MATDSVRRRSPSEVLRRGYSDDEIGSIYELGRLWLENGDMRAAETIIVGVTEVAPDFVPGWLALSYIHSMKGNLDGAIAAARQALRIDPTSNEAMLFLVALLLSFGDLNAAGTYLGEVGEAIEAGELDDPNVIRFYRMQLARFQTRP